MVQEAGSRAVSIRPAVVRAGAFRAVARGLSSSAAAPPAVGQVAQVPGLPAEVLEKRRPYAEPVLEDESRRGLAVLGRAVTNFVAILLAGPAALTTFRRAARRANFTAPVRFTDAE
ncbi:MAG: energy-coupling factor transport system substrate-specific component [Streptomyces sp.]|nr:energy-coupling factor transport system substrate-specific component [Streptomyces sp.]